MCIWVSFLFLFPLVFLFNRGRFMGDQCWSSCRTLLRMAIKRNNNSAYHPHFYILKEVLYTERGLLYWSIFGFIYGVVDCTDVEELPYLPQNPREPPTHRDDDRHPRRTLPRTTWTTSEPPGKIADLHSCSFREAFVYSISRMTL